MGRHREALSYYQSALRLKPGYQVASYSMGYSYRELGEIENAIRAYRKTIELNGDFVPESAFAIARIRSLALAAAPCDENSPNATEALWALSVVVNRGSDDWARVVLGQVPRRGSEQIHHLRTCPVFSEVRSAAEKKLGTAS